MHIQIGHQTSPGLSQIQEGLGFLVGNWMGQGEGDSFTFHEIASFQLAMDETVLAYHSRSIADATGFKHCEEGLLSYADREGRLLGVFVYGDGLIELAEGHLESHNVVTFDTREIIAVPRGKSYRAIHRQFVQVPEGIRYEIQLTLGAEGPFHHVRGSLTRPNTEGLSASV